MIYSRRIINIKLEELQKPFTCIFMLVWELVNFSSVRNVLSLCDV